MIARLRGVADSVAADSAVIDVGGVGYLVHASRRTLAGLHTGEPASLHIDTHIREDRIHLYGFADLAERDWFRRLTTVQGVGGRVALNILGVTDPDALTLAILAQDKGPLVRAEGVGAKLAQRILSELKDRAGPALTTGTAAAAPTAVTDARHAVRDDAISALANLGYDRGQAFAAVVRVLDRLGPAAALDQAIRDALKELAS